MDDKSLVGRITFSNVAHPNTWGIGESKALAFSCPSEAKRGEELFTAMQDAAFKAGREAGMREAAEAVDAGIVRGHIDGYGLDKAAQRNGMVLAYNAILAEIKGE